MRIYHPELEQIGEVEPEAFENVYRHRGWQEAAPEVVAEDATEPAAELTVKETLEAVGDDPVAAAAVMEAELAGQNRKTLIAALERIVTPADPANPQAPEANTPEET